MKEPLNRILPPMDGEVSLALKFKLFACPVPITTWLNKLFKKNHWLSCVTVSSTYCESSHGWPFVIGHTVGHQIHCGWNGGYYIIFDEMKGILFITSAKTCINESFLPKWTILDSLDIFTYMFEFAPILVF